MARRSGATTVGRARGPASVLVRAIPDVAGVVLALLVCGTPAHTQVTGPDSRRASPTRPEESAAAKLLESGQQRAALAELDRAANAYRRGGDRLGLARVALARSTARRALGEPDQAARDADDARALAAGDPALLLRALTQVAFLATDRSDFPRADAALQEALPIAEGLGAREQATTFRTVAILDHRRGRLREAYEHQTRAMRAADRFRPSHVGSVCRI